MAGFCPAVAPCHGEDATMELRTVLEVPGHRILRIGSLSSSEILRQQRCHEAWEYQLALYRILLIVLVLIALQSGDSLVGTTQLDTQLFATPEEVSVGIGERSRSTQVASRIGSFRLEGDGRRLVGADLDIAIELSAIGSFHESDIGIFHRLQACEIIIRTLQGRGAVGTSLLQGSGIQEHLMAQVDAVAVVAEIVDLPDFVSGVRGFRRITVSLVVHQVQGNGDVFPARDGICRKVDEILVEAEVSIINEEIGNTLALIIQRLYRETHSRFQHLIIRIIQLQSILYVLILYVILHLADEERLTGMQQIGGIQLRGFLPLGSIEGYASVQESLVLHRREQVLASESSLDGIIDDGLFAERVFKECKELWLLFLSHILLERPCIIFRRVALHFHLI